MRAAVALVLFLGFGPFLPAARSDGPPEHEFSRKPERRFLVEHMRIAAADRLIEQRDEIAAYLGAQFNTIVLYDTDDSSDAANVGFLKSELRIAFEIGFARAHGLHIVLGKATEPLTSSAAATRGTNWQGARRSFAAAAAAAIPDEEIGERLRVWDWYGHDLILGVFFLHDDAFLIHTTVERQLHLYELAHATVPDWYVFGMIGEFGFDAPPETVARYFDPNTFDHLLILMYPLNLGEVTGVRLDTVTSADPDRDMRRYVQRYVMQMGEKFITRLDHAQLAILVIQAFAYHGAPAGHYPRPEDIMIQATVGTALVRAIAGQERNRAIAYFLWDGSRGGMFGLWQRQDWVGAAEEVNRWTDDMPRSVNR
jgi:hypothetical protein